MAKEKITIKEQEMEDGGFVATDDEKKAADLAKDGVKVKLTSEQEGILFSKDETKSIAKEVGKALILALRDAGDEIETIKAHDIQQNTFDVYVKYKNDFEDEFTFDIRDDRLHLVDFSFDKNLVDVGVKPSGEAIINVDVLKNELLKHFKSLNEVIKENKEYLIKLAAELNKKYTELRFDVSDFDDIRAYGSQQALSNFGNKMHGKVFGDYEVFSVDDDDRGEVVRIVKTDSIFRNYENVNEEETDRQKYLRMLDLYKRSSGAEKDKLRPKVEKAAQQVGIKLQLSEAPEGMFYLKVDIRDARKAIGILDDKYRKQVEYSGSDTYYFGDETTAYDAMMDLKANDIIIADTNLDLFSEENINERVGALQDFINLIRDRAVDSEFSEEEEALEVIEALADHYGIKIQVGGFVGEIGMFHDPIGYEKSKPETPVFTKKHVGRDAYHILKNGKKLMTLFGSEGEANAYVNKRNRELGEGQLKEYTDDRFKGSEVIDDANKRGPDMFGKQIFADLLPKGVASENDAIEALKAHDKSPMKARMGQYAPMFVHLQYHDLEHEGEKYRMHQTQYYNSNFEDKDPSFNPGVSKITLFKITKPALDRRDREETDELGTIIVKTDKYIEDLRNIPGLGKRVSEAVNELDYDTYFKNRKVLPPNYGNSELHKVSKELFNKEYNKLSDSEKDKVLSKFEKLKEAAPGYKHDCAAHVVHETYGHGMCIPEKHTLIKEGNKYIVTHYDVVFKKDKKVVRDIPVNELKIITQNEHWHKGYKKKKKK